MDLKPASKKYIHTEVFALLGKEKLTCIHLVYLIDVLSISKCTPLETGGIGNVLKRLFLTRSTGQLFKVELDPPH